MSRDVCPYNRLRCLTVEACNAASCAFHRELKPIDERSLSVAEKYKLAMSEKRGSGEVP